jgi:hypothetical protein
MAAVDPPPEAPRLATNLEMLLELWGPTKRAAGGWWALAGFSFQAGVYLLNFFERLQKGEDPLNLVRTEIISDIHFKDRESIHLIQVKRTLTTSSLKKCLEEAYAVAELCDESLLTNIKFKIVCLHRETTADPAKFDPALIVGTTVNRATWRAMLSSFGDEDAIAEEPDPLDRLHELLWRAGIADTLGFMNACLGILSRAFGGAQDRAIDDMARALAHEFLSAQKWRTTETTTYGLFLGPSDVAVNEQLNDESIVFNRRPLLSDLRAGRFRERSDIFTALTDNYVRWWQRILQVEDPTAVPAFWIGGRSGEGKSVLLIQLVRHILTQKNAPAIVYLSSPNDLPAWLREHRDYLRSGPSSARPTIAVIDDLHLAIDRDAWASSLKRATDLVVPRVALLSCGPTLELQALKHELSSTFAIESFSVPNLRRDEMSAFAEWFAHKTGRPVSTIPPDPENRLLVIWMFELLQGASIVAFAQSFQARLRALGLEEFAGAVLAVNALGLPAPNGLVNDLTPAARDAFDGLCSDSQLHFERLNDGVALAHPQICWNLFKEWIKPPTTVAKAWGRSLACAMSKAITAGQMSHAATIMLRAGESTLLTRQEGGTLGLEGSIEAMLTELNATLAQDLSPEHRLSLLPAWLIAAAGFPGAAFSPDPVEEALQAARAGMSDTLASGYLAGALWRLSQNENEPSRREALQQSAGDVLMASGPGPGVDTAVTMIAYGGGNRDAAFRLCKQWLALDTALDGSGRALAPIVAAWPQDLEIFERSLQWLEGNLANSQAHAVILPLLSARPKHPRLRDLTIRWIKAQAGANQPVALYVLDAFLIARRTDPDALTLALEWVHANPLDSSIKQLLRSILTSCPEAEGMRKISENWIAAHADNAASTIMSSYIWAYGDEAAVEMGVVWCTERPRSTFLHQVLIALLSVQPASARIHQLVLDWLRQYPDLPATISLWGKLLGASQAPLVISSALAWAKEHIGDANVHDLLNPLVKIGGHEGKVLALSWLSKHLADEKAHNLLTTLVASEWKPRETLQLALEWLARFPEHPQAHNLYTPLVARYPGDETVQHSVQNWLSLQPPHPRLVALVVTLILRSDGAQRWMDYGERYVEATTEIAAGQVLIALAKASKADAAYVKRATEHIEGEEAPGRRRDLLEGLGTALTTNISNAVHYLSTETSTSRREIAADALAISIGKLSYIRPEFLDALLSIPSAARSAALTARLLELEVRR